MFEDDETPIFDRTDLRKGVSEAKFDVEADFDVKKSLAPPKSTENHEKTKKNSENVSGFIFFGVKKSKVANRPKRVFPKFRDDPSEVPNRPNRSTRSSDRATDRTDRRPPWVSSLGACSDLRKLKDSVHHGLEALVFDFLELPLNRV